MGEKMTQLSNLFWKTEMEDSLHCFETIELYIKYICI